ncbi:MAG: MBL fold metallo-hydrolase [candidate division WOR-3 bacterium]|nr:MAG: MBL fold metallo-hydrolase [candidate division WOR-3 bacterium]
MKIKFLGHASFLITSDKGTKIITDPYKPGCFGGGIKYEPITEEANIVTISHEHDDHNETNIKGNPSFVRGAGAKEVSGIKINGIETHHDESGGTERGANTIFNMFIDDMNVVHLGDLGHTLSSDDTKKIGNVDVLIVPVGGYFTIDAKIAESVINSLKPKVVIPMHFKTDKCGFPIAAVEDFTKEKDVKKIDGELEIKKETLPSQTTIYVLTPTK